MNRLPGIVLLTAWLALCGSPVALAQEAQTGDEDTADRSRDVEESDEGYRRRMELEDARQRNLGYTLPPETYAAQQEKIDKLPEESRDNIRDQLVDIIVEDGEWEPSDALKEYPYEPTAAARADPDLLAREQEAWDEQIDKYNKREAAAFGTYVGPIPGPGNPDGAEGGVEGGEGTEAGDLAGMQQGDGADGADGEQQDSADGSTGSAGAYDPSRSSRGDSADEVSTAGAQQSALEFLKTLQGQGQPAPPTVAAAPGAATPAPPEPPAQALPQPATASAAQQVLSPEQQDGATPAEESVEVELATPGIIAIEDLDKLEGADNREGADGP